MTDKTLLQALKAARPWLNLTAKERPESSHVNEVLAQVDAAIASAIEARSGETEGLDPKGESAVGVAETP